MIYGQIPSVLWSLGFDQIDRYNGAYSLAQASMNIFEANSYPKSDLIAVNNYGECGCRDSSS